MSSASPTTAEVLVIGPGWPAWLVADALARRGIRAAVRGGDRPDRPRVGFAGNGERRETARKVMGSAMADALWAMGKENRERALALGLAPAKLVREKESEDAFGFDGTLLARQLAAKAAGFAPTNPTITIYVCDTKSALAAYPSLADKLIPVTLTTLEAPHSAKEWTLTLFHGGADFRLDTPQRSVFGSYRNLFEDRAVGFLEPDPVTLKGLRGFFPEAAAGETHVGYETLSCDGLPVVGALGESPSTYVVDGFAGRPENFLFAVAEKLADGISGRDAFQGLGLFSTKRFV